MRRRRWVTAKVLEMVLTDLYKLNPELLNHIMMKEQHTGCHILVQSVSAMTWSLRYQVIISSLCQCKTGKTEQNGMKKEILMAS